MTFQYAYILPILVSVWFPLTFFITYGIAVYRKDVMPVFPYISDTGNWSPESCIFGLMLNIGSILMALVIYIRYRQIEEFLKNNSLIPKINQLNKLSFGFGITATIGVNIVANFQELNVFSVHVFGAVLAFGLGFIYECIQTYVSFRIYPKFGYKHTNILRFCCSLICAISFMVTFSFAGLSLMKFKGNDLTKWKEEDGGYTEHFVSAVSEWIMAIVTMLYLSTYTKEFKQISIGKPLIDLKE